MTAASPSNYTAAHTKCKALVLGDDPRLNRAITINLTRELDCEILDFEPTEVGRSSFNPAAVDLDLLIVAMSSPINNPILALIKTGLDDRIGRVPMLIISNNAFYNPPSEQNVIHLGFPLKLERLQASVAQISKTASGRLVV